MKIEEIKIEQNNDSIFYEKLRSNIHQYNEDNCKFVKENSTDGYNNKEVINLAIYIKDKLAGMVAGHIVFGWYYLNILWIVEEYRKLGIGTKIIKEIENIAISKRCIGIKTETFSFQAKEFYEKNNFEIYGILKDYPPNNTQYLFKKLL